MKLDIRNGDCAEVMKQIEGDSVDLTVTSPPYDNLRTYNGYSFNFEAIARELYRVTKPGGVVVWVVGDATVKGSETGTSFRQALFFKECGFNLHDTMIWRKPDAKPLTHNRYEQSFEYMFIFSKGKPAVWNGIKDKPNKWAGTLEHGTWRDVDGTLKRKSGDLKAVIAPYGLRHNVWEVNTVKSNMTGHPAPFPESLVRDHTLSWSNPGDTVLDPFMGSGTTGKIAIQEARRFIGIEISPEYCEVARQRIRSAVPQAANEEEMLRQGSQLL